MDIYKRIREIAERKRIQHKEIAEALGVGKNTVTNWLTEKTSMNAEQIPKIAKILRVSIEELFLEDGAVINKSIIKEETINVVNEPCPMCEIYKERIKGLNALLKSKEETIAALKGETKKEITSSSNQKAG